jgi:uncharacterized membrane protein YgaE (UPF0421/DUF939 family)
LLHLVFGIGGLVGPFLAAIFGSHSYFLLGVILAFTSFFCYFLKKPEGGSN